MDNFIPLEYDRSHLQTRKTDQDNPFFIDYFDIALILLNVMVCVAIISFYFMTPRKVNEQISFRANEKPAQNIPYFTYNKHGKKKLKELKQQKEARQFNPHTHFVGYNLVELKCLKCTHTTEIYQLKQQDNA